MDDQKPLLSIGDDGIEINLKEGDSIETHAESVSVQGAKQDVAGGRLEIEATKELTQTGNTMKVTGKGKIINEVTSGSLKQTDNTMEVDEEGTIINKI